MRSVQLRVFEHQQLKVGHSYPTCRSGEEATLEAHHVEALGRYHAATNTQVFELRHQGIKLRHFVGCLRVGPVSLEILPKLGQEEAGAGRDWHGLLVHMLQVVTGARLVQEQAAPLATRSGSLEELFLARFLEVTGRLLREGLVRSYREVEENSATFRGRLLVGPHVRANVARQERVFIAHAIHDADNLPNRALHRALERVARGVSARLASRAEAALMDFPEVTPGPIRPADWSILHRLDRRTERYREALTLARLILQEERPDLRWGDAESFALLFDMNALFERYLERALRGLSGVRVHAQRGRDFWVPTEGAGSRLKPDLIVERAGERPLILDAKWKIPSKGRPEDGDLRQLFAYLHAFDGEESALVYPRAHGEQVERGGRFLAGGRSGRMIFLDLFPDKGAARAGGGLDRPCLRRVREQLGESVGGVVAAVAAEGG